MSVIFCECPKPASLGAIPGQDCEFKLDQVVKMFFQRRQAAKPFVDGTNGIDEAASWAALINAADDTKITISPVISGLTFPKSEAIVSGGNDNSTAFGVEEYQGEGNVNVVGMFKNLEPARAKALDKYICESAGTNGLSNLTAYFVNRADKIVHNDNAGFLIYNLSISSLGSEGYNANNEYDIRFTLVNGAAIGQDSGAWDRNMKITTPETGFSPVLLTS